MRTRPRRAVMVRPTVAMLPSRFMALMLMRKLVRGCARLEMGRAR